MAEHTYDDQDMTGYFLPKDSQQLLTQIKHHLHFLTRLAQPRSMDETQEATPAIGMAELMFCLKQLAEQLERVLKDGSLLARSKAPQQTVTDRPQATRSQDEEEDEDEEEEEEREEEDEQGMHAAHPDDQRLTFGVTLDQFDKLRLMVASIKAFGDAVFADASADFAAGTLSMLGFTIFDRAVEVDDILVEIEAQSLPDRARPGWSVEEAAPAYGLQPPRRAGQARGVKETPGVYVVPAPRAEGLRLH